MPPLPASVAEATARWRGSVDLLGRYLAENIVFDVQHHVMTRDSYADFSQWLKDSGHLAWSEQNFAARLSQHEEILKPGVTRDRPRRGQTGSTLSRKLFSGTTETVPDRYHAWMGMRFRRDDDADDQ